LKLIPFAVSPFFGSVESAEEHDAQYQKDFRVLREELASLGWTGGSNVPFG
jgi:hypothetical protein